MINWGMLKERLGHGPHTGTARFTLPSLVLEIEPEFVVGARLESARRGLRRVSRVGVRHLEGSAVTPHPNRPNLVSPQDLRRVVRELVEAVGNGAGGFGLLVPDRAARVALIAIETLPDDSREADALIRWRMKASLPFSAEEARLSYQVLAREPNQAQVLAVAASHAVLADYESALEPVNGGATLILPATVALLPLLPEGDGAQLLVHVCSGGMTSVVVADHRICSWRTRELAGAVPEEWHAEVAAEAARILASARDHLKVEVEGAWLCARPPAAAELLAALARVTACEVEVLTPASELTGALSPEERSLFEHFGAPVAGLVANAG